MAQGTLTPPIGVGLIGTGYAAKVRAEVINEEPRAQLIGVAGHTRDKLDVFATTHQTQAFDSWQGVVNSSAVDLVIISNLNADHAAIARAALFAGKHVVVEYPLALDVSEAESLIALAANQKRLLHVEHIELMGGVHQALLENLSKIGNPFYARYATINPQRPAPQKWTFNHQLFGFPLTGALSRLHRFTHAFGQVTSISCRVNYQHTNGVDPAYYSSCLCSVQLQFQQGLILDVIYGKGEALWQTERKLEVHGSQGGLIFDGDNGMWVNAQGSHNLAVGTRRGLFAKDTAAVLDHLFEGKPLYVTVQESLYTLKVAEAARRSAETGQVIEIPVS
ncbi:Gfo/Idh/MocA family protein [Alkalinema pantanalense CENA528]|uniref:Gfo/Idh/MocA family protein n=1 Tax=Alkalinema pantanalense TaxID=1620705 RepID=UPI003D6F4518